MLSQRWAIASGCPITDAIRRTSSTAPIASPAAAPAGKSQRPAPPERSAGSAPASCWPGAWPPRGRSRPTSHASAASTTAAATWVSAP